jgi:proteasome accessory factor B
LHVDVVQRKVRTVSRKIERLINLTIALLATKRYLTKSEIFRTVEGYEGSAETKERMFERDKDDLRNLGITIDVGSFDPLFSDEAGYRIKSENYQLDLGEITSTEISLLSLAAEAWQGAALEDAAQSAILKLSSTGVPADPIDIPGLSPKLSNSSTDLVAVTDAIAHSNFLHFDYLSPNLEAQERTIVPIALSNRSGFWYVSGVDQEIQEVRTFRLDRIIGAIEVLKNKSAFEFPADFDFDLVNVTAPNRLAVIDVRKGKGHALRTLSESTKDLGEWDQIKVPIHSIQTLAAEILWHGEDVFVHQPTDLCEYIVEQLQALVANHE